MPNYRNEALRNDRAHMALLSAEVEKLQALITKTRKAVISDEAVRCVRELDEVFADAIHDCSLKYVRDLTAAGGEL